MTARYRVSHCHSVLGPRTLFHKLTLTPGVATTTNEADSGTAIRAEIVNNDIQNFEIETIPEKQPFSVSHDVVGQAMSDGVSLKIGGKIRVTFAAAGIVNRILNDE